MRIKLGPFGLAVILPLLLGASCEDSSADPCANPDLDGDGVNSFACGGTDCDDTDTARAPGLLEVCDVAGHDEDCDPLTFGDRDGDADGYVSSVCCNTDAAGTERCGNDCDDVRSSVHPSSTEACNGLDDDCDAAVDEAVLMNLHPDLDGDGYGNGAPIQSCFLSDGYSYLNNDCDDTNPAIVPGSLRCVEGGQGIDYQLCDQGAWASPLSCSTDCVPQPNGTGVCL